MEIFLVTPALILGIIFLIAAAAVSNNKAVPPLIAIGLTLILVFSPKIKELKKGTPAPSLKVLITGEKYEVVAIYEKYIIVKSVTNNNEKLKFIGPLDFETITTGRYIKTVDGLEKIEN